MRATRSASMVSLLVLAGLLSSSPAHSEPAATTSYTRTYRNGTRTEVTSWRDSAGRTGKTYKTTFTEPRGPLGTRYRETEIVQSGKESRRTVYLRKSASDTKEAVAESRYQTPHFLRVERNYHQPRDLQRATGDMVFPSRSWHLVRDLQSITITQPTASVRRTPAGIAGWRGITRGGKRQVQTNRDRDGRLTRYIETLSGPLPGERDALLVIRRGYEPSAGGFKRVHLRAVVQRPGQSTEHVDDLSRLGLRVTDALPEVLRPGKDLTAIDGRLPRR